MIKELEDSFEGTGDVKGWKFTKLASVEHGFMYERSCPDIGTYFEVFAVKVVPICLDFENRIYSETDFKQVYPKTNDFGKWAWCFGNYEDAIVKLNSLKI